MISRLYELAATLTLIMSGEMRGFVGLLLAVLVELQYWWHYSIMVGRRAD